MYEISDENKYFITHSDEELFTAKRSHIFVLLAPFIGTIFFTFISILSAFILQKLFPLIVFPTLLLGIIPILLLCIFSVVIKFFVDWYFHLYVITNRKLLEVCYKPFFSKDICVIPLDQMRCVEVSVTTHGFIKTLLDIGDVSIKLDLLTHQDIFTMKNIVSPQKTGIDLTEALNNIIVARVINDSTITPLPAQYNNSIVESPQPPSMVEALQYPQIYNTPESQKIVYSMFPQQLAEKGG